MLYSNNKLKYYGKSIPYSIILFGIYATDLHKIVLNILPLLWGRPRYFDPYLRIADIVLAVSICIIVLKTILRRRYQFNHTFAKIFALPAVSQIILIILYTATLLNYNDSLSITYYIQFIGGNILLFFGAIVLINDQYNIITILRIWIIMALILSAVSIWLFTIGATYTSARDALVLGSGIRTGYSGAIALILLIINPSLIRRDNKSSIIYFATLVVLFFAVASSGSKASFVFMISLVIAYLFISGRRNMLKKISAVIAIFISIIILMFIFNHFTISGFGKNLFDINTYISSIEVRIYIIQDYLNLARANMLFGSGISASYNESDNTRTHSLLLAFFVQVGLSGLLLYLIFIISTIKITIVKLINLKNSSHSINLISSLLAIFVFAILMGEVTSDIPGNRFLWLFSGLLLSIKSSELISK